MEFDVCILDVIVPMDHESVGPHVKCWRVELVIHGFADFELHLFDLCRGVSVVRGFREI